MNLGVQYVIWFHRWETHRFSSLSYNIIYMYLMQYYGYKFIYIYLTLLVNASLKDVYKWCNYILKKLELLPTKLLIIIIKNTINCFQLLLTTFKSLMTKKLELLPNKSLIIIIKNTPNAILLLTALICLPTVHNCSLLLIVNLNCSQLLSTTFNCQPFFAIAQTNKPLV